MDNLLKEIKNKLPKNCIYKIALIASVFAGKNNYCHHVLLAERVRPVILETRCASRYSFSKIFKTQYNKNTCKSICKNISNLNNMLSSDLVVLLTNLQYSDNAFFTMKKKLHSELYYPVEKMERSNIGVFRGYHTKYNGYFADTYHVKKDRGKYKDTDIENFKRLLNDIINLIAIIKNSPVGKKLERKTPLKDEFEKFEKRLNKLYHTGMNLLNNFS